MTALAFIAAIENVERFRRTRDFGAYLGLTERRYQSADTDNHLRYHESIANLTPADVYFGRGQTILLQRERIKRDTLKTRRLYHRGQTA